MIFYLLLISVSLSAMNDNEDPSNQKVTMDIKDIHQAATAGDLQTVKALIAQGRTCINSKDKFDDTPLMRASQFGHVALVQYLINTGAHINVCNKNWTTPLMYAVEGSHVEIIKLLLDNGAQVNAINLNRHTALTIARHWSRADVERILVAHGAREASYCSIL